MPSNFLTFVVALLVATLQFRSAEGIIGGTTAAAGEFPHHVALFNDRHGGYVCGGSIITPSMILSAAHCFEYETACETVIVAGVLDISDDADLSTRQTRRATDVIIHEYYDDEEKHNDLAILVLDYPFDFNEAVQSIRLPWENGTVVANDSVTVVGFAKTKLLSTSYEHLQKVKVPLIPQTTCQTLMDSELEWEYEINDSQFCAGVREMDACTGDSGGPAICTRGGDNVSIICGIVSFGNECGNGTSLSIYTNVFYYTDWIDMIIQNITNGEIFYEDAAARGTTCEYVYWDWGRFFGFFILSLCGWYSGSILYSARRQVYRFIREVTCFLLSF